MKPEKGREILLEGAKRAYPHAISAKSIKEAGLLPTAEQLVRGKLLIKSKFKGGIGYKLPEPSPPKAVIAKRPRGSGAAYEREVADAMKELRQSMGTAKQSKR